MRQLLVLTIHSPILPTRCELTTILVLSERFFNPMTSLGYIEQGDIDTTAFNDQYRTFMTHGYAMAPQGTQYALKHKLWIIFVSFVGNLEAANAQNGETMLARPTKSKSVKQREPRGTADDVDNFLGYIWLHL